MDMQLEEGEISETSEDGEDINPYTPLERPVLHFDTSTYPSKSESPAMDEENASSSNVKNNPLINSDSDSSDEGINYAKKMKLSAPVKNKYSIWNKDPNGDLTDFLNQVGIMEKPSPERCRNVENYPLPFINNPIKRKIPVKCRESGENNLLEVRNLDALKVDVTNSFEEVAEDISEKLKENNQDLILRIVTVIGKDKAIQFYEKARVIEKMGGMHILSGLRKRTSGGVFIFLVRSDKELSDDKLKEIFDKDIEEQKKLRKAVNKLRKKRRGKNQKRSKSKNKEIMSELSNPPPSPNLPELPPRKDVLMALANLHSQESLPEKDDDGLVSSEEMDFPILD